MPFTIRTLFQFAFFLSLLAGTPAVHACGQGGATCPSSGQPAAQPSNVVQVGAGNPINVITGNKYQREVDMPALPGVLGLEIVRHYNSSLSGPRTRPGALGRGWRLSYESSLYVTPTGITVDQADGSQVMFGHDLGRENVLLPRDPAQGRMEIVTTRRGDEYLWTWADGRKLRFNVRGHLEQIEAPTGEMLTMQYDTRGLLVRVTDPQGRSLQLHWLDSDTAKRADRFRGVQTIDSPVGRFSYGYGSERPKGATVAPAGLLANLVKVSYPTAGQGRRYHYESALHPTLMTGISIDGLDAKGKPASMRYATFGYGADGRANLSTHANDVDKVTLVYTSPETTTITNSLGQKTTYRFRSFYSEDRLLEVRGAGCSLCGEPNLRYGYDKLGRLTEVTKLSVQGEPIQTIKTTLDHYGRPVTEAGIAYVNGKAATEQRLARYEYGAGTTGNPTLIARPSVVPGQETITRISYNQAGQPLSVTESGWAPAIDGKGRATPIERTARYAYARINGRSLLTQIDGPLANGPTNSPTDCDITRIDWDARGNYVAAATTPGGFSSRFAYDQAARLVSVKNSDGNQTTMSYIGASRLAAVTQDGMTRRYRYDAMGRLEEVGVDAGQGYRALAHFGFDEANRRVLDASYVGILTSRRFDTEGKLLGVTTLSSRSRQERTYAYDAAGRLVASTDEHGGTRTLRWNAQGLPDAVTDALGRAQHFRYDVLGRLDEVTGPANLLDTAQPAGARTRFEQDAHGNTVTVVAPNGAVTQTFTDDFGQVIAVRSADAGLVTRTYDVAGRLVASSDANGNTARYAYDVVGRIVRQTVTDAHATDPRNRDIVTVWTYAGKRLAAIDHPNQSERYVYDGQGKLASKAVTLTLADGTQATTVTRYRYDQQGQLVEASLPDGSTLHYRRNGQNQIVSIERSRIDTGWLAWLLPAQTVVKDLQRDMIGLRRIVFGNGIETRYERSAEGALARIVVRRADEQEPRPTRFAALDALGVATAKAATAASSAKAGMGNLPTPPRGPRRAHWLFRRIRRR